MVRSYQRLGGCAPFLRCTFWHKTHSKPVLKDFNCMPVQEAGIFQDNFLSWLDLNCWLGEVEEFYLLSF